MFHSAGTPMRAGCPRCGAVLALVDEETWRDAFSPDGTGRGISPRPGALRSWLEVEVHEPGGGSAAATDDVDHGRTS